MIREAKRGLQMKKFKWGEPSKPEAPYIDCQKPYFSDEAMRIKAGSFEPRTVEGRDRGGYERGAKGFGELSATDREFLSPDFDRKVQAGQRAIGQFAKVGAGEKLTQHANEQLEGDDC